MTTRMTPEISREILMCSSAAKHLRAHRTLGTGTWEPALESLLRALSAELRQDPNSVPASIRCIAVQLSRHILSGPSTPVPRMRPASNGQGQPAAKDVNYAASIPFNRSINLGRMG